MNALCSELQPEEPRMLLREVHGLQLTPTKRLCPNRQTAGTAATRISQICPLKGTSQNQFALAHKKIKLKPNWEDRALAVNKEPCRSPTWISFLKSRPEIFAIGKIL